MSLDIDHLRSWIGRQETLTDRATLVPVAALSATLDRDDPALLAPWLAPFGGAAKLPWNLEWAAQWSLFGVTIAAILFLVLPRPLIGLFLPLDEAANARAIGIPMTAVDTAPTATVVAMTRPIARKSTGRRTRRRSR